MFTIDLILLRHRFRTKLQAILLTDKQIFINVILKIVWLKTYTINKCTQFCYKQRTRKISINIYPGHIS